MSVKFSVIIPLYNKEAEIARTIGSVLAQTYSPMEIVVVDDGSTDLSAEIVRSFDSPLIKLISQKNAGETAARNRAMAEARGDYFALIDADDEWRPGFLAETAGMINEFPGCGLYSTGFDIVNTDGEHPARTPQLRGPVEDFFRESMNLYVSIPSASVIPRYVVEKTGGFPEGMRLGGDQFMWTKIAREYPVCFSPGRLVKYYMAASNRSAAIYRPEITDYSFEQLYEPGNFWLNEYIARVALGKAIVISAKGGTEDALNTEKFFAYTRHSRKLLVRLRILNRLPRNWRPALHGFYTRMAWKLAKKGL